MFSYIFVKLLPLNPSGIKSPMLITFLKIFSLQINWITHIWFFSFIWWISGIVDNILQKVHMSWIMLFKLFFDKFGPFYFMKKHKGYWWLTHYTCFFFKEKCFMQNLTDFLALCMFECVDFSQATYKNTISVAFYSSTL